MGGANGQAGAGIGHGDGAQVTAKYLLNDVGDQQIQPEGEHERHQEGRTDDAVDGDVLHDPPNDEQDKHRDQHARKGVNMRLLIDDQGDVGADDDKRAVRQIDNVHDAPDEGEAQGHGGVKAAQKEPVDKGLPKRHSAASRGRICRTDTRWSHTVGP